jgi:hypothetical protein
MKILYDKTFFKYILFINDQSFTFWRHQQNIPPYRNNFWSLVEVSNLLRIGLVEVSLQEMLKHVMDFPGFDNLNY